MVHYRNLTKLFIRSLQINKANKKGGRFFFRFLATFCVLFIFLPFLAIITAFVGEMMRKLNDVGFAAIGFEVLISLVTIFIFIFSFSVLLNELYFSDDIENLLPLPIKPSILIASKFSSCFLIENLILFIVLLFSCGAYIYVLELPVKQLLLSIIGIILVPLAPMVYCVILALIFMYLLRNLLNKKVIKYIGYFFLALLIAGIIFMLFKLSTFDFEKYVENFADGNHRFLDIMRVIFPSINYFIDGLTTGSIGSILLSIVINIITFIVMLFFGKYLYYDGAVAFISHDVSSKKKSLELINDFEVESPEKSYFLKELKILFRSPTFFINCMLINIIWPIFLFLIFRLGMSDYTIPYMRELITKNDQTFFLVCFLCHVGASIIVPAFNSLASSSFSREGKNYLFIKYIPMKYGLQWRVKFMVSLLVSFICINIYMIPFYIIIHLPVVYILLFLLFSFMCIVLVSYIGLMIDSSYPKIIWDDEADSLRENYNAFIAMGFSLLFFGILCLGGYYLNHNYNYSFGSLVLLTFIILFVSDLILFLVSKKYISNCIKRQEV